MNNAAKQNLNALRMRMGSSIVAALLILFSGHLSTASAFQATADAPSVLAVYNSAMYDSAVYRETNVRPLNPLKFDPDTKSATVVTLTAYDYTAGGKYKPPFKTDLGNYYTWVSAVPEVQNLCKAFPKSDLKLNLEQLLGLRPNSLFNYFVTMDVTSGQIFRPATNPDPTTKYPCSLTKSAAGSDSDSAKDAIPANCGETFEANISDVNYRLWFLNKTLSIYVISDDPDAEGYP